MGGRSKKQLMVEEQFHTATMSLAQMAQNLDSLEQLNHLSCLPRDVATDQLQLCASQVQRARRMQQDIEETYRAADAAMSQECMEEKSEFVECVPRAAVCLQNDHALLLACIHNILTTRVWMCVCVGVCAIVCVFVCVSLWLCGSRYISLCVQALSTARKGLLNRNHPASRAARLRDGTSGVTKRDRERWMQEAPQMLRLAQSGAALFVSVAVYVRTSAGALGGEGVWHWRARRGYHPSFGTLLWCVVCAC